jgi:uroporphyrinogen decarboxylase
MTLQATLTGRERVNRMFARQEQDRIPRHESFWPETLTRFEKEGLRGGWDGVLQALGSDFHGLDWLWPEAFPGAYVELSRDEQTHVVRDGHGKTVRYWNDKSGTPEHIGFDCDCREKWEKVYKPALIKNGMQLNLESVLKSYRRGRAAEKWVFFPGVESFEETRTLMGDVNTLMAMAEDPEWVRDVSRTFTDVMLRNYDAALAAGAAADGIWMYGDMAYNHATMCSPGMYKELIWPDHKRMADWAHQHGMKFIYHTDGNINAVMDLYVAAGFDALQPLEAKAGMDVRKLVPAYGRKLAFIGNCDVMVYASNDWERIEEEIRVKLEAGKASRGYAYHSDHSVPPQVSWETYRFIMQMVERYGRYE